MRSVRRNSERFTRELGREVYGTNGVVSNGAMLHLGPAGRIGITEFRDPASGERRLGGVISADLYSLLEQHIGNTRERDGAEQRLECIASNRC